MITLQFFPGESKTGEKGISESHWVAASEHGFEGVGDTPLEAMTCLAQSMSDYVDPETR